MSVFEALRAATMVPARVHGLTDRGKIGEGMRADLVLLKRGVGLADVRGTRGIGRVWNAGVEFGGVADGEGLPNPALPEGN